LAYSVEIAPAAKRQIGKLDRPVQGRIVRRLEALGKDPRPPGVEKLEGDESLYRVRVGEYRIVYEIRDKILVVLVLKVGHRKEVHRGP
jgi:mRNA interferase RelE/StbE